MVEPLVAAIIPTRDRPVLVVRAIRSALAQSAGSLEVVVVDDGSVEPLELPSDLAGDPRVRVVRRPSPGGSGGARNTGIAQTRAEFLAFLDDDDEWLPGKLERELEVLQAAGDDVAGIESGWELWRSGRLAFLHVPRHDRDLPLELLAGPCMVPSSVVLRRSAFEAVGGFDSTLRRVEDWDLWIRLADEFRFLVL